MAYEIKDARNRSETYKEGGEVKPRHTPDRAPSMREAMLHKGGVKKSEKIEKNIKDFPELYKGYKSFEASKEKKKKYKEGGKVLSRSEEEQNKRDREYKAMKKRQHERRLKKKKDIVLSKRDKGDLAQAEKRIGQQAKHAIGKKQEDYDPGDIDITDITRNVAQKEKMKSWMKYREVVKQEKKKKKKKK